MKKFFATVFLIAAVLAAMKGCEKNVAKKGDPIIQVPKVTSSQTVSDSLILPKGEAETVSWVSYDTGEGIHDYYTIVNETVYNNLKKALPSFESLLSKGPVSTQMRNNGTHLYDADAECIDQALGYMYGLVCDYVYGYEAGNWEGCLNAGRAMCEFDWNGINKSYLFDIVVASKLPYEYNDGTVHVEFANNIFDDQGYVVMTNGRRLDLVGMSDAILSNVPDSSHMYAVSRWYSAVPNIITDQYEVIQNVHGDDGVCHIWNQSNTERCCRMEWNNIKLVGQSMYGCDPKTTLIRWEESAKCYVFEGPNGEIYGPADEATCTRINHLFEVQDAIANGAGDIPNLDAYVKNMVNAEAAKQNRK